MDSHSSNRLATYAVHDLLPGQRRHVEEPVSDRTPFSVDRQRVIQSTAFRRLEYKTQVFVTQEHDHFRTRLTHTLEVAEAARRLAVALQMNEVLAETIALAHDLGHPPFGHAGEAALNELLHEHGGFEHNAQSLRVVDYLEHPFPPFRGLNLTFEVREGLAKHETIYDHPDRVDRPKEQSDDPASGGSNPSIEGQIASLADRLAYDCHDLEDALGAGLIDEKELAGVRLWTDAAAPIRNQFPELGLPAVRRPILNNLMDTLVADAVSRTQQAINQAAIETVADVRQNEQPVVALSPEIESDLQALESFLLEHVYRHERLVAMDKKAREIVAGVVKCYWDKPQNLPSRYATRIEELGLARVVTDYVSGMTDRFCEHESRRLLP